MGGNGFRVPPRSGPSPGARTARQPVPAGLFRLAAGPCPVEPDGGFNNHGAGALAIRLARPPARRADRGQTSARPRRPRPPTRSRITGPAPGLVGPVAAVSGGQCQLAEHRRGCETCRLSSPLRANPVGRAGRDLGTGAGEDCARYLRLPTSTTIRRPGPPNWAWAGGRRHQTPPVSRRWA